MQKTNLTTATGRSDQTKNKYLSNRDYGRLEGISTETYHNHQVELCRNRLIAVEPLLSHRWQRCKC